MPVATFSVSASALCANHRSPRCRSAILRTVILVLASCGGGSPLVADVRMERIDGTTADGVWLGSPDGARVTLRTVDGVQTIALAAIARITFNESATRADGIFPVPAVKAADGDTPTADADIEPDEAEASNQERPALFHLADGGHLPGSLLGASTAADAVRGRTALGPDTSFSFDRLSGIQFASGEIYPRAHELFLDALTERKPGEDVLVTRSTDDVRTLRGRLERIDAGRATFVYGDRTRSISVDRVFGFVLAEGTAGRSARTNTVTVSLIDGSVFSGRLDRSDERSLTVETSVGTTTPVRILDVVDLRVHSDRVVYLSSLDPIRTATEGLLHRSWPVRMDRSVSGGAIMLQDQVFERGIGVHSKTELTFDLGGNYESFAVTIGIDDAVRPLGNVIFRILGDDRPLFESEPISGRDLPRSVLVDVRSVKELTLIVDYGEALDVADHADWADARLIKPPARADASTP